MWKFNKSLVKVKREQRGYGIRELGRRSGLSEATIRRVEAGDHDPRGKTIIKLAVALGLTPRALFVRVGDNVVSN